MSRKARILSDSKSLKAGISPAERGYCEMRRACRMHSPLTILQKMQAAILISLGKQGRGREVRKDATVQNKGQIGSSVRQ